MQIALRSVEMMEAYCCNLFVTCLFILFALSIRAALNVSNSELIVILDIYMNRNADTCRMLYRLLTIRSLIATSTIMVELHTPLCPADPR